MLPRWLGCADYAPTFEAMRAFTEARDEATPDELWLCEHPPVYTLGIAGRPEHLRDAAGVPVVHTNRGGQVTFHGPGQVVAYPLVDLRRLGVHVKEYVFRLEQALVKTLEDFGVTGLRVPGAPGVYVRPDDPGSHAAWQGPADPGDPWRGLGKIAALGIKLSRHRSYHGVALNVQMDLSPFDRIDPCGYPGLRTVDLSTIGVDVSWDAAARRLADHLLNYLQPR